MGFLTDKLRLAEPKESGSAAMGLLACGAGVTYNNDKIHLMEQTLAHDTGFCFVDN